MIIYKVTNKENGKVYIGKTILSLKKRRQNHYSAANQNSETNFHRALRKYDRVKFSWVVLEECNDEDVLTDLEVKFINEYNSFETGYNMTRGGDGGLTYKKGDELYERIKHKFGKWKNGNPGATPEAIKKRQETFKSVTWPSGWTLEEKVGAARANEIKKDRSRSVKGSKNPMYGKTPGNARRVEIDSVQYDSIAAAARKLNISNYYLRKKCLNKNVTEYKYLD